MKVQPVSYSEEHSGGKEGIGTVLRKFQHFNRKGSLF